MGLYDETIGTLLVGIFFNTFLYGLITYQFATYYRMKLDDPPAVKYMVLFLFVLDTFHSASAIYLAWYYTVTNYGNPAALAVGVWPYMLTPACTALAALVTQTYLGFRVWRLTSSKFLYGIVMLLAIPTFILGVTCTIEAWIIRVISKLPRITPLVIAWLSMQVIVDTFITVTLVIAFSRSRTGFQKTDTILNRFIRGAIQTGLFAGIFSLGDLISFVALPSTNLYGMFAIPIGRIYTNTLLDTLLARESFRADGSGVNRSTAIHSVRWPPSDSRNISTAQSTSIQLEVQRTTEVAYDHSSCEGVEDKAIEVEG